MNRIKQNTGECIDCGYFGGLIAKRCQKCYWSHRGLLKKESLKTPENDQKDEEPKTEPPKTENTKQRSRIAPVSAKRLDALKTYRRARDAYFKEHPVCEFPGCTSRNITLHHKRGRVGAFLTDKRWFCSLCQKHHTWVEEHPKEAQKMQLSLKRLDKFK